MDKNRGRFVVLEGVEGAGKSTQVRLLGEWLESCDIPFTLTREPGGTEVGEAIRHVVQDRAELSVPPETELLLYLAARAAFVQEVALPVLERGELLIADRFSLSTFAYQGFGRGLDLEEVRRMDRFASALGDPSSSCSRCTSPVELFDHCMITIRGHQLQAAERSVFAVRLEVRLARKAPSKPPSIDSFTPPTRCHSRPVVGAGTPLRVDPAMLLRGLRRRRRQAHEQPKSSCSSHTHRRSSELDADVRHRRIESQRVTSALSSDP